MKLEGKQTKENMYNKYERYDFVIIGKNAIIEGGFTFRKVGFWRPRIRYSIVLCEYDWKIEFCGLR